jgi:hypothetical protein
MPYSIGERGSYGCSGYPVVKDGTSDVMGCHDSAEAAGRQIAAIEASENKNVGIKNPEEWPEEKRETDRGGMGSRMGQPHPASRSASVFRKPKKKPRRSIGGIGGDSAGAVATIGGGAGMGTKSEHDWLNPKPIPETGRFQDEVETRDSISREIGKDGRIKEGDFVMGETTEGLVHGVVEHIMWEGGTYGQPGTEYAIESKPENPAMAVRIYEADMNETWVPTAYSIGMMYSDAVVVDMEEHSMEEYEKETMFKDFGKDFTRASRLTEIFKAESVRVGQMVSWNSSGGRATGKVKRIISSGSYNVPGTEFTINGTEENPAVVITLYRNGKATDQTVAHRRSSLRAL